MHGNQSREIIYGRMNITNHKSVLLALEDRANRFKPRGKLSSLDDRLYANALDETGTVGVSQCVEEGVDVMDKQT